MNNEIYHDIYNDHINISKYDPFKHGISHH